jgi:hypothetical protein
MQCDSDKTHEPFTSSSHKKDHQINSNDAIVDVCLCPLYVDYDFKLPNVLPF